MFWECKTDPMAERKKQERPRRSCYILATLVFENVNHKKKKKDVIIFIVKEFLVPKIIPITNTFKCFHFWAD